jgi:iron complex transport system substrate-binding protein
MTSLAPAVNFVGVVLAVALGSWGLTLAREDTSPGTVRYGLPSLEIEYAELPNGERAIKDESGLLIPIRDYRRVVSASTISDALLLEFASPNQIAAFTQYSVDNEVFGYRYSGKPQIDALKNMEGLLALQPDLLLVSTLSSGVRLERLRELGLTVFSLGEMRGVASFLRNVRAISALLGRAEQGELYAKSTLSRLESIARHVPQQGRKSAIQLTYYGNKIYGSGAGTSYTDVLRYAGLIDAAADEYEGWPAWSPEQVLSLNPDVIVTRTGMGTQLCTQATFATLKACVSGETNFPGVVELPDALINDPGVGILLSAERIHAAVYGSAGD